YISPKFRTPVYSTVIVSLLALSSLVFSLDTVASFISFGALAAFTIVHISVIAHYFFKNKQRSTKDSFLYLVIPMIGIILCVWLWTSLSRDAFILGISWFVIGALYLAYLTKMFKKKPPELSFDENVS